MANRSWGLAALSMLLLAGCGLPATPANAPAGMMSAQGAQPALVMSRAAVPAGAQRLKFASIWIMVNPFSVRPSERAFANFQIQASKPIRNYNINWSCTGGRLDFAAFTQYNTWTAPAQPGAYQIQAWVQVWYQDGTMDQGFGNQMVQVY